MTRRFKFISIAGVLAGLLCRSSGRAAHQDTGPGHQPDPGLWPAARNRIHHPIAGGVEGAGIDAEVDNAGVSGDTIAGGLSRLDWSLADHPDAAIMEMGSNDMLRGIPPAETEKNLRAILTTLQKDHVPVLLTGMQAQRNLGAEYVAQFDAIYPRLAKEYTVVFYPFFLDGVALNPKLNQADGHASQSRGGEDHRRAHAARREEAARQGP